MGADGGGAARPMQPTVHQHVRLVRMYFQVKTSVYLFTFSGDFNLVHITEFYPLGRTRQPTDRIQTDPFRGCTQDFTNTSQSPKIRDQVWAVDSGLQQSHKVGEPDSPRINKRQYSYKQTPRRHGTTRYDEVRLCGSKSWEDGRLGTNQRVYQPLPLIIAPFFFLFSEFILPRSPLLLTSILPSQLCNYMHKLFTYQPHAPVPPSRVCTNDGESLCSGPLRRRMA